MTVFQFRPLEFVWVGDHVWFSALDLQIGDWGGALAPTVDRIDPERGYSFGNMEWVTHSENSRRGGYWRPSEHGLTQYGERLA